MTLRDEKDGAYLLIEHDTVTRSYLISWFYHVSVLVLGIII
jgi:hypothetical protein